MISMLEIAWNERPYHIAGIVGNPDWAQPGNAVFDALLKVSQMGFTSLDVHPCNAEASDGDIFDTQSDRMGILAVNCNAYIKGLLPKKYTEKVRAAMIAAGFVCIFCEPGYPMDGAIALNTEVIVWQNSDAQTEQLAAVYLEEDVDWHTDESFRDQGMGSSNLYADIERKCDNVIFYDPMTNRPMCYDGQGLLDTLRDAMIFESRGSRRGSRRPQSPQRSRRAQSPQGSRTSRR